MTHLTTMKITIAIRLLAYAGSALLISCNTKTKEKLDKEVFEEVLNDSRVNSKEVGEREGIKYFQVIKNGKTGFRDLANKIVIEPQFDNAEMFSEGYSSVQVGNKCGLIDETGKFVLPLQSFEFLGSVHNGLANFRRNDKIGFINAKGQEVIKPQFDWVDDFSEGLCVVRNDNGKIGAGKYGYIDTTGKVVIDFKFQYANNFENGRAKFELNNLWGAIDKRGEIIEPATHKYISDW